MEPDQGRIADDDVEASDVCGVGEVRGEAKGEGAATCNGVSKCAKRANAPSQFAESSSFRAEWTASGAEEIAAAGSGDQGASFVS